MQRPVHCSRDPFTAASCSHRTLTSKRCSASARRQPPWKVQTLPVCNFIFCLGQFGCCLWSHGHGWRRNTKNNQHAIQMIPHCHEAYSPGLVCLIVRDLSWDEESGQGVAVLTENSRSPSRRWILECIFPTHRREASDQRQSSISLRPKGNESHRQVCFLLHDGGGFNTTLSPPVAVPVRARQTPGGKHQHPARRLASCHQQSNSAAAPHIHRLGFPHPYGTAGLNSRALAALGLIESLPRCHLISASDVLQHLPWVLTRLACRIILRLYLQGAIGGQKKCLRRIQTDTKFSRVTFISTPEFLFTSRHPSFPMLLNFLDSSLTYQADENVACRQHCLPSDWRACPTTLGKVTSRA